MDGEGRTVRIGRRRYRLIGPDLRDPRLHVASVVVCVQVLGQLLLRFDVSLAQILVALATCALIESAITFRRDRAVAWPASALLTGNGVALVLRVPGTHHGDWWSLRGAWIFAAVAAVSLLSKYLVRVGGRPLFNPSNIGLVLAFLLLGSGRVEPLDLWWVRPGVGLALALAVIVPGGLLLTRRMHMAGAVAGFWLTFAAGGGLLALRGHCITAQWHVGPVCDGTFWRTVVTSPEILVFMFFMITDPRTAPRGRSARVAYGILIALAFVALAAPQRTEYATKVALLVALALACAARPLLERLLPATGAAPARLVTALGRPRRRTATALLATTAYAAIVVGAGASAAAPGNVASAAVRAGCDGTRGGVIAAARPVVAPVPQPEVRVANAIDVATTVSLASARHIVRDVLDDLTIASRAVEQRDPAVAAEVARPPWLDSLVSSICAPGRAGTPDTVLAYRIDHATVAVARRAAGQLYPEIDVELRGTVTQRARAGSAPATAVSARTAEYDHMFVVARRGGFWLVCGDRSDPRTQSCVTSI